MSRVKTVISCGVLVMFLFAGTYLIAWSVQGLDTNTLDDGLESSQAVSDVNLNEDEKIISLELENNVQQNNEYQTVAMYGLVSHNKWHNVTINKILITNSDGEYTKSYSNKSLNGNTIITEFESNESYTYKLISDRGVSEFTISTNNQSIIYVNHSDVI